MAKEKKEIGWQVHAIQSHDCPSICPSYVIYKSLSKLNDDFFNSIDSKQDRGEDIWVAIPIYKDDIEGPIFR